MINYKELTGLIDAGKDEEIIKALQGLPEQAVIALMDMQDAPHKQYLINVLNPFVPSVDSVLAAQKGDTSNWDDEIIDYAFRTYANGDMPKEADFDYDQAKYEQAFDKFMSDGSPFHNYVAGLRKKYGESITGNNDDTVNYQSKDGLESYSRAYADALRALENYNQDADDYRQLSSNLDNAEKEYLDALSDFANDYAPEDVKHSYLNEEYDTPEVDAWEKYVFEGSPWEHKDVNGDDDTDVITADTNGNGEPDTAVAAGDNAKEEKDAVKAAKEDLGLDGEDDTSTGKKKKELEEDNTDVLSDKKQKDTCSDSRQKNILSALSELRF